MSIESSFKPSLPLAALEFNRELDGLAGKLAPKGKLSETEHLNQLKTATQEFEALFVGYLFKVMRSTVEVDDEESKSLGKDVYMDMFDNEIASSMAKTRSLGIGDLIYQQLADLEKGSRTTKVAPSHLDKENPLAPGIPTSPPLSRPTSQDPARESLPSDQENNPEQRLNAPVQGLLTSAFGFRRDPVTQKIGFHHGMDIASPLGTPFHAAQSGTVVFSGLLGSYGNTVIIEHANGYRSLYAHASRILVSPGEKVTADQPIGIVGSTGHSTGAHLHFELQKEGERIDPEGLMSFSSGAPKSVTPGLPPKTSLL